MMEDDPYELLGVARDADFVDVKLAYRRAALKYHPDNHGGRDPQALHRFKQVTRAYRTIRATFGPFAAGCAVPRAGQTLTPADFAAGWTRWRPGRRQEAAAARCEAPAGELFTQKCWYPTVNEPRLFLWFWALGVALGVVALLCVAAFAAGPQPGETVQAGDLVQLLVIPIGIYVAVVAVTLGALVSSRTIIWLGLKLAERLLPAPLRKRGPEQLCAEPRNI